MMNSLLLDFRSSSLVTSSYPTRFFSVSLFLLFHSRMLPSAGHFLCLSLVFHHILPTSPWWGACPLRLNVCYLNLWDRSMKNFNKTLKTTRKHRELIVNATGKSIGPQKIDGQVALAWQQGWTCSIFYSGSFFFTWVLPLLWWSGGISTHESFEFMTSLFLSPDFLSTCLLGNFLNFNTSLYAREMGWLPYTRITRGEG